MVTVMEISRVNKIIGRELALLAMQGNANRRHARMENWLFVLETFRKLCFENSKAKGIICTKEKGGKHEENCDSM